MTDSTDRPKLSLSTNVGFFIIINVLGPIAFREMLLATTEEQRDRAFQVLKTMAEKVVHESPELMATVDADRIVQNMLDQAREKGKE